MGENNLRPWGLKVFLASVLLFFLVATVEGRVVSFVSLLTPEYTGTVTAANRDFVGQSYGYLAEKGRNTYSLSSLVVSNIDPSTITRVQMYHVDDEEYVGTRFSRLPSGYYAFDGKIEQYVSESINIEKIELHIFTEKIGNDRPALSGLFVCNRTTFLSHLIADEEVTAPTGVAKNDGFVSGVIWSQPNDNENYFLSLVVNHDLDETVTSIVLGAPAASNTINTPVYTFTNLLNQGAKALQVPINASVVYWLRNDLGYINILTAKNPAGALRGQVIPTTSTRGLLPTLPKSFGDLIFLPDGGAISGNIAQLKTEGARNKSGDTTDDRVCVFLYNASSKSFDNDFRFNLPVTIRNKYVLRTAVFYFRVAAEVNDTNKYTIGVLDLNDVVPVDFFTVPGTGRKNFERSSITIDAENFPRYLGPGGIFVTVQGSNLNGAGLFVDRFWMEYSVVNAYASNIVKSIFYRTSSAQT
jgi:hypothetical protein